MTADKPLLGIALMLGFCILAPMGDSMAKLVSDSIPLLQLIFVRFAIQVIILSPIALSNRAGLVMSPRLLFLVVLRTILHILGVGFMFMSLRFLPLADAIAIGFVMPFIMLLLGYYFLNEVVGTFRLSACVVGFLGTLLVIQPSFAVVGLPALLPLCVAVIFAFFMLLTRKIAKQIGAIPLQTISGLIACMILGCGLLVFKGSSIPDLQMLWPDKTGQILVLFIGINGTIAHLMMTWSLRFAPSATLAPMQYLEIPFATLIGWVVFNELPNGLAALGIIITISAGLIVIYREQIIASEHKNNPQRLDPTDQLQ